MKRISISSLIIICLWVSGKVSAQAVLEAQPYGGRVSINKLIQSELQYPREAFENNINCNVSLKIAVAPDGNVQDINVTGKSPAIFNTEAIRLARLICWEPAQKYGLAIQSEREIIIPFDCKKYKKWVKRRGYDLIKLPENIDTSYRIYQIKMLEIAPQVVFQEKDLTLPGFFKKEFHYPVNAIKLNLSGIVEVQFIVEPTGHVTNMRTLTTVGGGCTEEAVRLMSLLHWKPGIKNGKAVRTIINFPVHFNLSNSGEYKTPMAQGSTLFY